MSNLQRELIEKLSEIKVINEKNAIKIIIDFLHKKNQNLVDQNYWSDIDNLFKKLSYCEKCNKINSSPNNICEECSSNNGFFKNKLVLLKTHVEHDNLKLVFNNKSYRTYILDINSRQDLIKFFSFSNSWKKIHNFINEFKIKEIIFALPFSDESDLLIEFVKSQLSSDIDMFSLAMGIPSGKGVLEYIDPDLVNYSLDNKRKI